MNRIVVDGTPHLLTEAYLAGATAHRLDASRSSNPYALSEPGNRQWQTGFDHEADRLHACDGVDLVQLSPTGSRSFYVTPPTTQSKSPKRDALRYAHARMVASGMLSDTRAILAREGLPTPGALVERLRKCGHALTIPFANLVIRRLQLESEMTWVQFSPREMRALDTMTPLQRKFMLTVAELQDAYFDRYLSVQAISRHLGKNEYWAYSMAQIFARDGLRFLIQGSSAVCRPTSTGWAAVDVLRSIEVTYEADRIAPPIAT